MKKTNKNYRHGDLTLFGIDKLPEGLKLSKTKVLIKSSGGNAHSINKGSVYFKDVDEYVFGYLVAKDTTLFHKEHGDGKGELRKAKIEDGIYELRRQNEKTHESMRKVED